ncbi:MAG: alpha/beta fold hydrolase [Pirellulaceae bacterium]|nr:alpha/beta fold hydrolase [Pirellulaceae bacterium]
MHIDGGRRRLLLPWAAGARQARRARRRLGVWLLAIQLLVACGLAGCSSTHYVAMRRVPQNPFEVSLNLLGRSGPRPTPRTEQLLRRYDLHKQQAKQGDEVLERLQAELVADPSPEKVYSLAELAYVEGKRAEKAGEKSLALDHYGLAVANSYQYLFDPRFDRFRNPYDPQFRGASNLYNVSLEAALRIVNEQGKLQPGQSQIVHTAQRDYVVNVVVRGPWHNEDFERFEFVSDYEIKGLRNLNRTYGLGVPLIAVRRNHEDEDPRERYYPPGLSFPVTAFLRVLPPDPEAKVDQPHHCVLELYDPLSTQNIQVADRLVPLETDLSTPLGFFLDNPNFAERRNAATLGLLDPNRTKELSGLYMLEPFDPQRIPVVMVHGLWSSPLTWMEMFNDLQSFPEIRNNFQFWFYLYPTGQPFWFSASQLRQDLADARQSLDPHRATRTLDQLVLVGHSMGGLVSNMQIVRSRDDFWNILSDKPFEQLQAEPEVKERLAGMLFFEPNPSVRRVVTIGTPHRGSEFANDYTRWLGRKLIALPASLMQNGQRLARNNPDFFRNTQLLATTTSIDSLAPDAPILPVILSAEKPNWVKRHNIVGVVPNTGIVGRLSGGGDGVVSFESAHLDDVESEIVVEADHVTVHQHPRAILEVRRILRDHLTQMVAEAEAAGTVRAGFEGLPASVDSAPVPAVPGPPAAWPTASPSPGLLPPTPAPIVPAMPTWSS